MNIRPATPETIAEGARILQAGGLVAFPTETVYGLGADATQSEAVAQIFEAKGRPSFNPLIVHVRTPDLAADFSKLDSRFDKLAAAFWPGPLSLVMKRRTDSPIAELTTAGLESVALRCPAGEIAQALLSAANRPLAAPSANRSGAVSPTRAAHVAESLEDKVDLILDGGPCSIGLESTVLDLTSIKAIILRPGAITMEQISALIGPVVIATGTADAPKSPGQMLNHYAPSLPLRLNASAANNEEALLGFGSTAGATLNLSANGNLAEAAANLFAMLRTLDDADRFRAIAVAPIPGAGLGLAINDRLGRAASRQLSCAAVALQPCLAHFEVYCLAPERVTVPSDSTLINRLKEVVGRGACITDASSMAPYLQEERGLYTSKAIAIVKPASSTEMAAVVEACASAGAPIVPQGGNTGLCGGAAAHEDGREVIVNLGRMNKIRAIDPINFNITVDAGCILADIQRTAAEHNCLFPLSLAAEGSCQIGGNLATNAGGINVLRYGNARELVLGLEVVLPDGRIWNGLRSLGKDNTGYALRHLFVGAEGTLGIITAAVLKLFPRPTETATALCALDNLECAIKLLNQARGLSGDAITAFELIPRIGLEMCAKHISGATDPFAASHAWYVLIELSTSRPDAAIRPSFDSLLESAFSGGIIEDAVVAESLEQSKLLWCIRESLPEAQKHEGGSIKHDVSVPVSRVPEFIAKGSDVVANQFPGARPVPFGHLGDGNIHFNVSQPVGTDKSAYLARWTEMKRAIHDLAVSMGGSFSAEHGIGRLNVQEMSRYKDPVELDLMVRLKRALDPKNLMNPGKVVDLG